MKLTKKQQGEFASLSEAINASADGFIMAAPKAVEPFVKAGLVETNETISDDAGNIAVRLKPETEGTQTMNETKPAATAASFSLDDNVPMPTISGRGRGGNVYPFDQMEVGQSFFVPNSEDKPNAAKSLASTVSSATARYAVPSEDGATKKNKAGEDVPVMVETRKFVVRSVEENGVKGARVWRTK